MTARLVALIAAAGCGGSAASEPIAIVGGAASDDARVVAVTIAGGACSGVLVAPTVVLTAAHCAVPGVGLASPGTVDDGAMVPSGTTAQIVALWVDRAYTGDVDHDLAALRLDHALATAPAPIGAALAVGDSVELVGYGEAGANQPATRGTRRTVTASVTAIAPRHLVAGQAGATTCVGDSGGAAFAGAALVGLVSAGNDQCTDPAQLVRPDAEPDLAIVIAAWSGPCPADGTCDATCATPDPDCDPCAFQGTCGTTCVQVDLDCPLGGAPGAACTLATDCESRDCVPAPEGADRGSFCSQACVLASDCAAPLDACTADVCTFLGGTPGIPGAPCMADPDCRSSLCDQSAAICTTPCGDHDACPVGLACEPVRDGRACTIATGCAATRPDPALVIVALVGWRFRRRALQSARRS